MRHISIIDPHSRVTIRIVKAVSVPPLRSFFPRRTDHSSGGNPQRGFLSLIERKIARDWKLGISFLLFVSPARPDKSRR